MNAKDGIRRGALAAAVVSVVSTMGGCGGGAAGGLTGTSTPQHLTCAKACIPSDSVSIDQLRASYMLVDNGQNIQALASFGTGSDPRANVEISGSDQIQLVTSQGTRAFQIPSTSLGTAIAQAFLTLFAGAAPYESDVNSTEAASPVQFQFIRGGTTYSSTVTLAPSFVIANPAPNSTQSLSNPVMAIRLNAAFTTPAQAVTLNCTDTNGNTGSISANLSVQGTPTMDSAGTSYTVDLSAALNAIVFSTSHARGAISSCDGTLSVTLQTTGQVAAGLTQGQILAQRSRSLPFSMR